jgi:hypothetical protein
MTERLHNFPFWILAFDKNGQPSDVGAISRSIAEVKQEGITDLFIFSHGWNNDRSAATKLYQDFFGEMSKLLEDQRFPRKKPAARIGVAGVIWPSILWPDDLASASMRTVAGGAGAGAAGFAGGPAEVAARASPQEINHELKKAYDEPRQQSLVDSMTALLETQASDEVSLNEFHAKLAELLGSEATDAPVERKQPDYAEGAIGGLSTVHWRELLEILGDDEAVRLGGTGSGGAAGLWDPSKKLWAGAKEALRIATYYQMKQRAGIVGREGLGGMVLTQFTPDDVLTIRVHLLGHSFGARLVCFSLSGLPASATRKKSPVKSVFLPQGAFSHYAFADSLPHDADRAGALKGMADRVDGPLLTTHSLKDLAVGLSYPVASFMNGEDAAAKDEQKSRWGAMGHDGAQAVGAGNETLAAPGKQYPFQKGKWLNLDGNKVIIHGGLPSGAHGDVVHPHTAWAALAAAAIV